MINDQFENNQFLPQDELSKVERLMGQNFYYSTSMDKDKGRLVFTLVMPTPPSGDLVPVLAAVNPKLKAVLADVTALYGEDAD
jgi:hypothetical protein